VVVADDADGVRARGESLARSLGLPVVEREHPDLDLFLVVDGAGLSLLHRSPDGLMSARVDLVASGVDEASRRGAGLKREPLARAIGMPKLRPVVVDATAGLCRDALRMAVWGCSVTAVERSPVLAALLADGFERAVRVPRLADIIGSRLSLVVGDSRSVLSRMSGEGRPDVVYLDPMFPSRRKTSAKAKKEMRIFRLLVGDDVDAGELFEVALAVARRRVVVKRLRSAPVLGRGADVSYGGKIVRYDVYMTS
jgi:16S rRNA (guanine1516-N2)-methyltransferase